MKQIVVIFWSFIFGEVLGYIGGALNALPYHPLQVGIVGALVGLIATNMITMLSRAKK